MGCVITEDQSAERGRRGVAGAAGVRGAGTAHATGPRCGAVAVGGRRADQLCSRGRAVQAGLLKSALGTRYVSSMQGTMRTHGTFLRRARRVTRAMTRRRLACEASRIARQPARSSKLLATQNGTRILGGHAAVPRALQLRVALEDWDRNDVHERVRA